MERKWRSGKAIWSEWLKLFMENCHQRKKIIRHLKKRILAKAKKPRWRTDPTLLKKWWTKKILRQWFPAGQAYLSLKCWKPRAISFLRLKKFWRSGWLVSKKRFRRWRMLCAGRELVCRMKIVRWDHLCFLARPAWEKPNWLEL